MWLLSALFAKAKDKKKPKDQSVRSILSSQPPIVNSDFNPGTPSYGDDGCGHSGAHVDCGGGH